jgi:hypothetical protein
MVDPKTGIFSKGHSQGDKNHFTLYAYGQDFVVDIGSWLTQTTASESHNYIYIDDKHQASSPPAPYDSQPSASDLLLTSSSNIDYIHGDATDAFNYLYLQGPKCTDTPPYPAYCIRDQSYSNFAQYVNPVEHAQRYVNFIREANGLPSYIIITDDIKKNSYTL